jgi:hypothetical protein
MAENQNVVLPKPVLEAVAKGRVVFYGEYRRGLAVEFSGKGNKLFHQSKQTVETETGTITVTEFLPDTVDWKTWAEPFKKGQMVFAICRGLEESSGVLVANAKLFLA